MRQRGQELLGVGRGVGQIRGVLLRSYPIMSVEQMHVHL